VHVSSRSNSVVFFLGSESLPPQLRARALRMMHPPTNATHTLAVASTAPRRGLQLAAARLAESPATRRAVLETGPGVLRAVSVQK